MTNIKPPPGAAIAPLLRKPHPFRILHILRAPVGGLFRHVRDLAMAQNAAGHAVGIVCDATTRDSLTDNRLAALAPHLSLGLHRTPMPRHPGWQDLTAIRRVRDLADAMQIGILHGHGAKGGACARLAARKLKRHDRAVRVIYTPHGGVLHFKPTSPTGYAFLTLERLLLRHTDAIVFESDFARRRFVEVIDPPRCREAVIHNGLTPSEFEPCTGDDDAADFLFVGELRALKGVDCLLEALGKLDAAQPVTAVIVGDGPDRVTFESQCRTLGLADRVTFPGAMPAAEAFRLGRVLVVPSRAESLPYVVLEAAAAGLPVIATNVGGIPEIVAGTATPLVPPGDAGTLAEAMRFARDNPDVAAARAAELRTALQDRFALAEMARQIECVYAAALSSP